ncbi:hypothetical protein [Microbacterium proteolyticum]|uniref:hypothetical protein n=1 Tax=Microbacterium proteolyticum TaxID=1572644 RepID=UPI001FAB58EC|nr:hypothetical protein [Microbacterium proteolyticum]MCI9859272.1 hypothetical protein [Microbacterium proteolyticum]
MTSPRSAGRSASATSGSPGPTFWLFNVTGVVAMIAAWVWFGMAFEEEMSEQPKAVSAGTTMAGLDASLGIPPLVLAHVIGLGLLGFTAFPGRRRTGRVWIWAVASVTVASLIGLLVAQWLYAGRLFLMGADGQSTIVP